MVYQSLHQMNLYDVFGDQPWSQEDFFSKDRAYMKKICSKKSRELMRWVEDVCDEEEYDGSPMFDEYPDPLAIERMTIKAYDNAGRPDPEEWAKSLITSMLYNEICYRRRRRNEFKQKLYRR